MGPQKPAGQAATRFLAIDPGERRTGIAATDWTGTISIPLDRIEHRGFKQLPDLLAVLLRARETQVLVVGLPLNLEGQAGPQARKVLELVRVLAERFPQIEVVTANEAHSSDVAHAQLKDAGIKAAKRRRHADSLAALEILRRYRGQL